MGQCWRWIWAGLVGLFLALPSHAGPWPREEGGVFLSFSVQRDRDENSNLSLYGEFGLGSRRTLGMDLSQTNLGERSGLVWMEQGLGRGEGPNRFAVGAGLGVVEREGVLTPLGQLRAGWGRGVERLPGGGWLSAEASVQVTGELEEYRFQQGYTITEAAYLTPKTSSKATLTLGFRPLQKTMLINQLRLEDRDDTGFSSSLATSSVFDLPGPAKLELGIVTPLKGPDEGALKLGTWFEF